MTFFTLRQLLHMLVLLSVCATLLGCAGSTAPRKRSVATKRETLEEHIFNFITAGVTTKEDVLIRLGEADNFWPESQLQYFFVVNGLFRQVRRSLFIDFDKEGIVTSAQLLTQRCFILNHTNPCDLLKKVTISKKSSSGSEVDNSP